MEFLVNLQPHILKDFEDAGYRPEGWLLSAHRLSPSTLAAASTVTSLGQRLMADNGTMPLIRDVIAKFEDRAAALAKEVKVVRHNLPEGRRVPWPREVPPGIQHAASSLASDVAAYVKDLLKDRPPGDTTQLQLSMGPTDVIAQENFTSACHLALGLDREITLWDADRYAAPNRDSLRRWHQVVNIPGMQNVSKVYMTINAVDYYTARVAGRVAASGGVEHIAYGFAGLNLDRLWVRCYRLSRRKFLPGGPESKAGAAARRGYVRLPEILAGIVDGYSDKGQTIKSFHALGLGAIVQYPCVVRSLPGVKSISVDSTAPILDAGTSAVFYDHRHDGDRISALTAAADSLNGHSWPHDCPFCQSMGSRHPSDDPAAQTWWACEGQRELKWSDLEPASPLASAYPLFVRGVGPLGTAARDTRQGHNHWAARELTETLKYARTLTTLDRIAAEPRHHRSVRWGCSASAVVLRDRERS